MAATAALTMLSLDYPRMFAGVVINVAAAAPTPATRTAPRYAGLTTGDAFFVVYIPGRCHAFNTLISLKDPCAMSF